MKYTSIILLLSYLSYLGESFSVLGLLSLFIAVTRLYHNRSLLSAKFFVLSFCVILIILVSLFIAVTDAREGITRVSIIKEILYGISAFLFLNYYRAVNKVEWLSALQTLTSVHLATFLMSIVYVYTFNDNFNCITTRDISWLNFPAVCGILFNPNYFAFCSVILLAANLIHTDRFKVQTGFLILSCICSGSRIAEISTILLMIGYFLPFLRLWLTLVFLCVSAGVAYTLENLELFIEIFDVRFQVWSFLLLSGERVFGTYDGIKIFLESNGYSAGTQNTFILYFLKYGYAGLIFIILFLSISCSYLLSLKISTRDRCVIGALFLSCMLNMFVRNHMVGGVGFISQFLIFIYFFVKTTREVKPS